MFSWQLSYCYYDVGLSDRLFLVFGSDPVLIREHYHCDTLCAADGSEKTLMSGETVQQGAEISSTLLCLEL